MGDKQMRFLILALITLLSAPALAQDGAPIPDWYQEHVEFLTRDGGRWIADNSEYMSEQETASAYVVVFSPSFGGASMTGDLFGIDDGENTVIFWEFRSFWDPVAGEAIMSQFGWGGAYGSGRTWADGEMAYRTDQIFSGPGQPSRREGHLFSIIDDNTHDTTAYTINQDGSQTPSRTYRWVREV